MISNARIAELTDYREAKAKDGVAFCQIPTHELAALIARLVSAEAALKPFSGLATHEYNSETFCAALDALGKQDFRVAADHFAKVSRKDPDHGQD